MSKAKTTKPLTGTERKQKQRALDKVAGIVTVTLRVHNTWEDNLRAYGAKCLEPKRKKAS